tara:strand:+ start:5338 stop:5640 length:303 start_codon:yes stop_codon:yes gene_type:complete
MVTRKIKIKDGEFLQNGFYTDRQGNIYYFTQLEDGSWVGETYLGAKKFTETHFYAHPTNVESAMEDVRNQISWLELKTQELALRNKIDAENPDKRQSENN